MTPPKPTMEQKAKTPASLSHLAGIPLSSPHPIPTGTISPTKTSTKIKLQLKNKGPILPSPSEGPPVGASSTPIGIISPTNKSTKIRLQLKNKSPALSTPESATFKNKRPALPAPSEGTPISSFSSTPTGTMSPIKRPTEIENLFKRTASPRPFTWPPETRRVYDRDYYRPNKRARTEPLEPELQGHKNEALLEE